MKQNNCNNTVRAGFTLTELMITLTIFGMVMAGIGSFFFQTNLMLFTNTAKLQINSDIRSITNEMTDNARNANHFTLYDSFYDDFRNPTAPTTGADYRQRDAEAGDLVVFIFYGVDAAPWDTTPPPIERLVGYYRSIDDPGANTGPIRKFDIAILVADQNDQVEELIPAISTVATHETVVELSEGLANGRLFYNFRERSVMVNGQIYHGNDAKRVTGTYNFTISPRG
jgi:prepilin-type N-terminal cleavage/methylation domain-containing protein